MTKNRYEALDGLRALACLGIITKHVLANTEYQLEGFLYREVISTADSLVAFFMMISAFSICCGYYQKVVDHTIDFSSFYIKRIKRILPLFAALSILELIMKPSIGALCEAFANMTLFFGFIPNADISVIGVGWFIGVIFIFYFMFPFFCFLISSKRRAWFAFGVLVILNLICDFYFHSGNKNMAFDAVFFMAGCLLYLYREVIADSKYRLMFLFAFIVILCLRFIIGGYTLVMLVLFMSALACGICASDKSILCLLPLRFLGQISFEMYLFHMVVFRLVEKAGLLSLTANNYINYWLVYVSVVTGAVLISLVWKKAMGLLLR